MIQKIENWIQQQDPILNNNNKQMELYGCYFLSIIGLVTSLIREANTYVLINNYRELAWTKEIIQNNMYVQDAKALYNLFAKYHKKPQCYIVSKELPLFIPTHNEHEIQLWSYTDTSQKKWYHFVAIIKGEVTQKMYDPYGNSNCVALGKIVSKRIFTIE